MTNNENDEKRLSNFLKRNAPEPVELSSHEFQASLQQTSARLEASSPARAGVAAPKPWFFGSPSSWFGASGFAAAALVAAVVTTKQLPVPMPSTEAQKYSVAVDTDSVSLDEEDTEPALEVGQDWLDLLDEI
jgi:hypothetical protein